MDYNYSNNYPVSPDQLTEGVQKGAALFIFGMVAVWLIVVLAIYIYLAICLMKIAKKTNTPNGWFAWIPILNIVLMIQIARKPMWWIIMFFIPLVNIIFSIMIWMGVAEALKKPSWLGILMIVPIANVIIPGYLAFSKDETAQTAINPPTP
jgi:hypothetical protein